MLFNSWTFVLFFVVVYLSYLRLRHGGQNRLLLVAGFVFYGYWDYRFLLLLMLTTLVDYGCGLGMSSASSTGRRRAILLGSLAVNLGTLGFFKYCDFFIGSLVGLADILGFNLPIRPLGIILPLGISFYTFQEMSYVIDVYRGVIPPCRSLRDYAAYVSFFPQLVAGPIERASHLLRQMAEPRVLSWDGVRAGLWLLVKGMFLKVVIADNAARIADRAFNAPSGTGAEALLGVYAFAIQIYCDFGGYSNIARGLAALMGFDIVVNFRQPYFATNPADFWRRWHISLSTWLRDYLFLPLSYAFSRRLDGVCWFRLRDEFWIYAAATLATMLLGGLWHGADWKFLLWGAYQGVLLTLSRVFRTSRHPVRWGRAWLRPVRMIGMFHLTCFGWLIFRCNALSQVLSFPVSIGRNFAWDERASTTGLLLVGLATLFLLLDVVDEWGRPVARALRRSPDDVPAWYAVAGASVSLVTAAAMLGLIYLIGVRGGTSFIYFQF